MTLEPPPCPVHEGRCTKVERIVTVPPGYLGIIGPSDAVGIYVGDVPCLLARHEFPPQHPAQLLIAMAPVVDEWEGDAIEPLRNGAFALCSGIVIDRNCNADVCLYDSRLGVHCRIANFLMPSMN